MAEPLMSPEGERVVWIEYRDGRPFAVVTSDDSGGSSTYDFEWCKRDKTCYYHMSGSGPADFGMVLNKFCEPDPPPAQLWLAEGIEWRVQGEAPSDATALALGYAVIAEPLVLVGWEPSPNPFDFANAGETIYCAKCVDHLPTGYYDDPCTHLTWCDECEGYVYESVRHMPLVGGEATIHEGVKDE